AVPAVLGATALVAPVLALLAEEAVVLEVVDDLEQREAEDRLDQEVRQDHRAEGDRQPGEEDDGHRPGGEDVVVPREPRLAEAVEPLALDLPGRAEAADDGARQEGPEALAEAGGGGVLRGRDPDVVAAVVLD